MYMAAFTQKATELPRNSAGISHRHVRRAGAATQLSVGPAPVAEAHQHPPGDSRISSCAEVMMDDEWWWMIDGDWWCFNDV